MTGEGPLPSFSIESPEAPRGIHPTAIVHPSARIDPTVEIGPYAVIGEDVSIGPGTRVGSHAVVEYAAIGASCRIHAQSFIGTPPQDLKYRGEKTVVLVGDGTIVRECVTVNRGTAQSGRTVIGKKCLLMAYSHVAHDCVIEDEVILANSVAVAGHVQIGMGAVIGGLSGIHQFVRIGRLAMVGAGSMVPMDVPPFCTVWGDRARIVGLNLEGLKRRHVSKESVEALKKAYRKVFLSGKPLKQALRQIASGPSAAQEIGEFARFIAGSSRGVCRPRTRAETSAAQTW